MSKLEDAAFGLSQDELQQISYLEVLKRRRSNDPGNKKFSANLSMEAQIAMQQALEDMEKDKVQDAEPVSASDESSPKPTSETSTVVSDGGKSKVRSTSGSAASESSDTVKSRLAGVSYTRLYERHSSVRMQQDITDEDYSSETESRKVLGGGSKLANAMEIIEFVNHDNPSNDAVDDEVIEELARINSVEKCEVWMQATPLDCEVFEQREYEAE